MPATTKENGSHGLMIGLRIAGAAIGAMLVIGMGFLLDQSVANGNALSAAQQLGYSTHEAVQQLQASTLASDKEIREQVRALASRLSTVEATVARVDERTRSFVPKDGK